MSSAKLKAEQERNAALRATLANLNASSSSSAAPVGSSAQKAQQKVEIIGMQKDEEGLKQKIEQKELAVQHLMQQMKEDKEDLNKLSTEMDTMRNAGKAIWESVGFDTIPYHDPFHTGLSKRTPTGARRRL